MKNGDQLLRDLKPLKLPLHTKLFTTDAHSMYNNIDTNHDISVITWWVIHSNNRGLIPLGFLVEAVLSAMVIIMKNNIFEFRDLFSYNFLALQ